MYELIIKKDDLEILLKHAKTLYPIEACALLFGYTESEKYKVKKVLPAENILNSPISFKIDPVFLFEAYRKAEEENLELVSIFHSHPAPPFPSSLDLKYMFLNPVPWIILSMPSLEFKVFIYKKDKLEEVKLTLSS